MYICGHPECQQEHDGFYGSNRFCSSKCARSFSSLERRQKRNEKISESLTNKKKKGEIYSIIYHIHCPNCHEIKIKRKQQSFCSKSCSTSFYMKNGKAQKMGLNSSMKRVKRSKNEIYFSKLCEKHFDIKTNENLFNGWDADIIIEDFKLAILWNGKWHYVGGLGKCHSLKQVQNRDSIKINEIRACGYEPYIIKDLGRFNKDFVNKEFIKLQKFIKRKIL